MESSEQIQRKFIARDHRNLVDRFAKPHERDALRPGWKAAQVEETHSPLPAANLNNHLDRYHSLQRL